jgi:GT2 family glycosyltransferase
MSGLAPAARASAWTPFEALAWSEGLALGRLAPDGRLLDGGDGRALVRDSRDSWLVLTPADGLAPPRFRSLVEPSLVSRLDVDVFYGDDLALGETSRLGRVRLKSAFDITQLVAQDYVGAPLIVRGSALHRLGGLREALGPAAVYDLLLRAAQTGMGIDRIPELLLAWPGARPVLSRAARRPAIEAWIGARPLEVVDGLTPESFELRRRFDAYPAVTLVIPTRQSRPRGGEPYVAQLLDSLARTDWPHDRLTALVGDDADQAGVLASGRWPFEVRRVATPRPPGAPFDYAAKMNTLWRLAETEHIVLLNDDVQVRSPGWLKALMVFAMDRDVGGVGARLLFPDGRLQHVGVIGGLLASAVHGWFGLPADAPAYQDWPLVQREWSMVTGAVFATRRAAMEAAGGFDPRFTLEFNDVDLCLRMRLLGLRIVYTPFAELSHREKASRGETPPDAEQVALFLNRWRDLLADDPAYHPALTRDRWAPEPAEGADLI